MYNLEISRIPEIIEASDDSINLMFVGDTGIGKTTVIENYCKDKNIFLKTLILSQLEASETLGIPVKTEKVFNNKTYQVLDTAVPLWVFELAEQPNSMLFLDEFLCAQPSVMNAFLNFLTQKNVNGIDLSHVKIVAATNIGNYTFEPDSNILSRFCWFYTVNTEYNKYIKDKRIKNTYKDETPKDSIIFDQRSLKPRCQESLSNINDKYLNIFYEGFTNSRYMDFHINEDITALISPFVYLNDSSKYIIDDCNINTVETLIRKKYPRAKSFTKILNGFKDFDKKCLNTLTKKLSQ